MLEQLFQDFFPISEASALKLFSNFERIELKRGDYLIKAGDYSSNLFVIESGLIRQYAWSKKGEFTQWIGTRNHFVTDLASFIFDRPSIWNFQCVSDCAVYRLSKSDYQRMESEIVEWNKFEKAFLAKCFCTMEQRISDFICLTAEERYVQYFEQHKLLFQQVPLQYIASVLGMSPETLSRIRAKISS
ncbi:Crp/Fnr family transcriptional regulator [Sphingobacterium paramultivorum]|uniref:Crp/Fnr family transcriptional regulator n=1 Tax=Sphingobacterium paramultivorum TaxID=2886510 RepID=A0A7G5E5E3_9SPHI|nr:Crp/Fnr family transcriptional regulator [Sphingobacterium paramultivorum]QMV69218.1 Crp/Fnr family transcriptional regulator [Sphingobacterium paramultivorum]WSO13008.1 Crp/Fnr family transcriptional regulator [Sphingobacterium paramultivorum]